MAAVMEKKAKLLDLPKYRSNYGLLSGAIGKIGGKEVVITHRNPDNGYFWCEGEEISEWVNPEAVDIFS